MVAKKPSSSRLALRFPAWQREYEAALKQTSREELFERIEVAEPAIRSRIDALEHSFDHYLERQAMKEALLVLLALKEEQFQFSTPELVQFSQKNQSAIAHYLREPTPDGR